MGPCVDENLPDYFCLNTKQAATYFQKTSFAQKDIDIYYMHIYSCRGVADGEECPTEEEQRAYYAYKRKL